MGGRYVEGRFVEGLYVEGRFVGRTFCSGGRFVEGRFVVFVVSCNSYQAVLLQEPPSLQPPLTFNTHNTTLMLALTTGGSMRTSISKS
jgi:hypothetical protein